MSIWQVWVTRSPMWTWKTERSRLVYKLWSSLQKVVKPCCHIITLKLSSLNFSQIFVLIQKKDSKIEVNFQLRSIPNCCLPQHYLQYPARLNEKCVTIWHYQMCEPNRTPYLVLFLLRKHVAFYIPLRNKCHNFNSWIKIAWYCFTDFWIRFCVK